MTSVSQSGVATDEPPLLPNLIAPVVLGVIGLFRVFSSKIVVSNFLAKKLGKKRLGLKAT
jgi:hypothetical protein